MISGREFNRLYRGVKLYKFTNLSENHNGFQFKTGLNIDTVPFNPTGNCEPGGIYFTEAKFANMWKFIHTYCRDVTIPDDAQVYAEYMKFKADKLILGPRRLISSDHYEDDISCLPLKQSPTKKTGKRYFPQPSTNLW